MQMGPNDPLAIQLGTTDCAAAGVVPTGLVVAGDKGVPVGLTSTYYKSIAPRIGLAWSPSATDGALGRKLFGGPGKTSIRAGYGIFYNPIEQLVMEAVQRGAAVRRQFEHFQHDVQSPFQYQDGTSAPNPFNGILNPPRNQPVDWAMFRPILLYGQAAPNIRSQYAEQYNLSIQREFAKDLVFQIAYVGRQGHRLLATTQELNPGNPQTCLDLNANLGVGTCTQFGADSSYFIDPGTVLRADLHWCRMEPPSYCRRGRRLEPMASLWSDFGRFLRAELRTVDWGGLPSRWSSSFFQHFSAGNDFKFLVPRVAGQPRKAVFARATVHRCVHVWQVAGLRVNV